VYEIKEKTVKTVKVDLIYILTGINPGENLSCKKNYYRFNSLSINSYSDNTFYTRLHNRGNFSWL